MDLFTWIYGFVLFAYGVLWVIFLDNLRFLRQLREGLTEPKTFPMLSILIPARNEERNIRECLETVLCQDYPRFEVLVYDDHSADKTAEVVREIQAKDPRVRLLPTVPLPPGWAGKVHACAQLAEAARGEYLLFMDADVRLRPGALKRALAWVHTYTPDLFSLLPALDVRHPLEALTWPLMTSTFLAFLPLRWLYEYRRPRLAGALGPFMLFHRAAYWEIGGHRAIPDEIVEDLRLAALAKAHGRRVLLVDGPEIASVRFYQGLRETWDGLTKSAFGAFRYRLGLATLITALASLILFGPIVFYVLNWGSRLLSGLAILSLITIRALADRKLGYRRWPALFVHLTFLFGLLTLWYSVYRVAFKSGVSWKDRLYPLPLRLK